MFYFLIIPFRLENMLGVYLAWMMTSLHVKGECVKWLQRVLIGSNFVDLPFFGTPPMGLLVWDYICNPNSQAFGGLGGNR